MIQRKIVDFIKLLIFCSSGTVTSRLFEVKKQDIWKMEGGLQEKHDSLRKHLDVWRENQRRKTTGHDDDMRPLTLQNMIGPVILYVSYI